MEKQSVTNDVSYLFATLYSICYLAFLSYVLFPLDFYYILIISNIYGIYNL